MKKYFLLLSIALIFASCGPKVTADFRVDKTEVQVGQAVQFTTVANEDEAWFHWEFGDGSSSRESSPSHVWSKAGTYKVTLHLTNFGGDRWDNGDTTITVIGYNYGFINHWAITESYTTDSCGNNNKLYNITIRPGNEADEVWVDNFGDVFNFPVRGRTPYGDANKIEFNETNMMTESGEVYNIVGNFVLNGNILDINYTLTPNSGPTVCGVYNGDGLGISY
jgi:hypothetical protein